MITLSNATNREKMNLLPIYYLNSICSHSKRSMESELFRFHRDSFTSNVDLEWAHVLLISSPSLRYPNPIVKLGLPSLPSPSEYRCHRLLMDDHRNVPDPRKRGDS